MQLSKGLITVQKIQPFDGRTAQLQSWGPIGTVWLRNPKIEFRIAPTAQRISIGSSHLDSFT